MNTTRIHKDDAVLEVALTKSFNLHATEVIKSRLSPEVESLILDLTDCLLIDSEAVIFMYKWQKSGKRLKLKNPPEVLFEIITILELDEDWNLKHTGEMSK